MPACAVCSAERPLLTSGVAHPGARLAPMIVKMIERGPASVAVCESDECRAEVRMVAP